jgi:predicted nucleotidyltransferase
METTFSDRVEAWAVTPQKVDAAVRRAIEVAQAKRIYLFGSYVTPKADGSPPNDLDMLVVADDSVASVHDESVRIRSALKDITMAMDIVVVRKSRFERFADVPGNVIREALTHGRLVHHAG